MIVIIMTLALPSDIGFDTYHRPEFPGSHRPHARTISLPLVDAKLRLPAAKKGVTRTKLLELLERSASNYAGTLLVGRAGSGKTTLAADFAWAIPGAGWYSIDASDADWNIFSRYFRAMVLGKEQRNGKGAGKGEGQTAPEMFDDLLVKLEAQGREWPGLLVMDGLDHLFDSKWFAEFFVLMMASLPPHAHVLVLSRTKPPTPLWRLRSKQVINVLDEKVLAFSLSETEKLFAIHGRRNRREAVAALEDSYGRAGKLVRFLETTE